MGLTYQVQDIVDENALAVYNLSGNNSDVDSDDELNYITYPIK